MDGLMTMLEDATGLPPAQIAAYALAALVAWTIFVKLLRFGAPRFAAWARTTPSPKDDEIGRRLVWLSDVLDAATMALWRWIPRLAWGTQPYDPAADAGRRSSPPRTPPPLPLLVLTLAALLGPLSAGCGATARDIARSTVLAAASAVAAADQVEGEAYRAAGRRAFETIEARISAGELERGADALIAYREIMAPHDTVEAGLRGADSTLEAAEAVVDAWEAGGMERWIPMLGCITVALARISQVLTAAEVDLPEALTGALETVGAFGEIACDGGGA